MVFVKKFALPFCAFVEDLKELATCDLSPSGVEMFFKSFSQSFPSSELEYVQYDIMKLPSSHHNRRKRRRRVETSTK